MASKSMLSFFTKIPKKEKKETTATTASGASPVETTPQRGQQTYVGPPPSPHAPTLCVLC